MNSPRTGHVWRFDRIGGVDQVRLETAEDLRHLGGLDRKLWMALACPARGLECDERTLRALDADGDGRIRAPELLAALEWTLRRLRDPASLLRGTEALALEDIAADTPEGQQTLASAREILASLGKPDATLITPADTADTARIFAATRFNGDGVIVPESADDPELQQAIRHIIECLGSDLDRSGRPGVSGGRIDRFFAEAAADLEWWDRGQADPAVRPLGETTEAAAAALAAVREKVEDYFNRCRLAAFDPRATAALNGAEQDFAELARRPLAAADPKVRELPLARIEANRPVPLREGINPAWREALGRLREEVVRPLLGEKEALSEEDWRTITARLAPFEQWQAARPGTIIRRLGPDRVRALLAGGVRPALEELLRRDLAMAPTAQAIFDMDRLVLLHRDLGRILNNFVTFRDFYDRGQPALFQAGTLYLDRRACELCLRVEDSAKHAVLAGMAGAFLAYCECRRPATGERLTIVAAFTNGDSDRLLVGRNGLFIDRQGRDWDATITRIVENPISLRQAFWSPYKKLVRMIEEQVAKRAAAAEAAADQKLLEVAEKTAAVAGQGKAAPAAPRKLDIGILAAMGVAFGAISTFLATVFAKLVELAFWQILLVLAGVVAAISGPSVLVAWLKLRQRNLGPILDANGWAVNGWARLTPRFGRTLTRLAELPPGAERSLRDPYAPRPRRWLLVLLVVVGALAIGWIYADRSGLLHRWTKGAVGREPAATTSTNAPPTSPAPPASSATGGG